MDHQDHTPATSTYNPQQHQHQHQHQQPRSADTPAWINDLRHQPQESHHHHGGGGGQYRPYVRGTEADPYQTPKLAQPSIQQAIGRAAPGTIPLDQRVAPPLERRALNARTEFQTRDICRRCNGTRYIDRPSIACRRPNCGRIFSLYEIDQHNRHMWRDTLPCGHSTKFQATDYLTVECPDCTNSPTMPGTMPRTVTFGELVSYLLRSPEFLNPLLDILEGVYPGLTGPTTAEQRALIASRFTSSEPSAPTPHLTGAPAPVAPSHATQATPTMLPPLPPVPDDNPSQF